MSISARSTHRGLFSGPSTNKNLGSLCANVNIGKFLKSDKEKNEEETKKAEAEKKKAEEEKKKADDAVKKIDAKDSQEKKDAEKKRADDKAKVFLFCWFDVLS